MEILELSSLLGEEIQDLDEECFSLFSTPIPSLTLGSISPKESDLTVTLSGLKNAINVKQSPTLLTSCLPGGTTGAVCWTLQPLFADWLLLPANPLFKAGVLGRDSVVLELGSGIAGITALGLALGERVDQIVCTDQEYVLKTLRQNIEENLLSTASRSTNSRAGKRKGPRPKHQGHLAIPKPRIDVLALDWETSDLEDLPSQLGIACGLDAILASDCIYNEALVEPFVRTCADICALRERWRSEDGLAPRRSDRSPCPTVCIIAQQLRSNEVFEDWLRAFSRHFRIWRIPDSLIQDEMRLTRGYVVHVGVLKTAVDPKTSEPNQ